MIPLVQRIQVSIPTGATTDVALPQVKPGEVWRVTHLALSDDAAGDITVVFGVTDIVGFRPLFEKFVVTTGDTAWYKCALVLLEEDKLVARVTTTGGNGQVTFSVCGEILVRDYVVVEVTPAAAAPKAGA